MTLIPLIRTAVNSSPVSVGSALATRAKNLMPREALEALNADRDLPTPERAQ